MRLLALFFIKHLSADINKEVLDLKMNLNRLKNYMKIKFKALEAKIEKLEHEKEINMLLKVKSLMIVMKVIVKKAVLT